MRAYASGKIEELSSKKPPEVLVRHTSKQPAKKAAAKKAAAKKAAAKKKIQGCRDQCWAAGAAKHYRAASSEGDQS